MELQEFIKQTLIQLVESGVCDTVVDFDIGVSPNRYFKDGEFIDFVEVVTSSPNRMKFSITIK